MNWYDLLSKPYVSHGRGPDGYDCWGLVKEIYRRLGIALPDDPYLTSIEANFERVDACQPYDIVAFKIDGLTTSHVGVVLSDLQFIHVTEGIKVRTDYLNHRYWAKRLEGFYRWKQ